MKNKNLKIILVEIVIFSILLFLSVLTSCNATREIPVYHTEYRIQTNVDSIYLHDSIYVSQYSKNDTTYIFKEKTKYKYKNRYFTDTLKICDTIPYYIRQDTDTTLNKLSKANSDIQKHKYLEKYYRIVISILMLILFLTNYKGLLKGMKSLWDMVRKIG